jgi:hypothetical protein
MHDCTATKGTYVVPKGYMCDHGGTATTRTQNPQWLPVPLLPLDMPPLIKTITSKPALITELGPQQGYQFTLFFLHPKVEKTLVLILKC